MAIGKGKYDALCTAAREAAGAKGAILIIIDGEHGPGFSVQAPLDMQLTLPDVLEFMAKQIRAGHAEGQL